ncbi:hypothetical protein KCH_17420 [Kitasatospora cheerisanensis KCTC 2395]|uniref:Uncharacterized protein n=1 Tax=Kitasatospora cheerisanensis KCTC 2395 TaxID=1348663 RepID=A0A066Z2N9_9ACTN|nr:hypothetical protein KCH_17420 [Kitasatospora cheerisanensis KCTC 2395]
MVVVERHGDLRAPGSRLLQRGALLVVRAQQATAPVQVLPVETVEPPAGLLGTRSPRHGGREQRGHRQQGPPGPRPAARPTGT